MFSSAPAPPGTFLKPREGRAVFLKETRIAEMNTAHTTDDNFAAWSPSASWLKLFHFREGSQGWASKKPCPFLSVLQIHQTEGNLMPKERPDILSCKACLATKGIPCPMPLYLLIVSKAALEKELRLFSFFLLVQVVDNPRQLSNPDSLRSFRSPGFHCCGTN